jgi:hypothetical protein
MIMCCTKYSSVINSIYSGQELFSYNHEKAKPMLPPEGRKWQLIYPNCFKLANQKPNKHCAPSDVMDKLQQTRQHLGQVFNFRCGFVHAVHSCGYEAKLSNLKLKTLP